jgi:hypothetical protein
MGDERKREFRDPYPKTLEGVYEELDYWSKRQGEGVPTSYWEEGARGREVFRRVALLFRRICQYGYALSNAREEDSSR